MSFMLHDVVGWNPTIEDILVSARTESTNTTHAIENNHTNNSGIKVQVLGGEIGSNHVIGDGKILFDFIFISFSCILFFVVFHFIVFYFECMFMMIINLIFVSKNIHNIKTTFLFLNL